MEFVSIDFKIPTKIKFSIANKTTNCRLETNNEGRSKEKSPMS